MDDEELANYWRELTSAIEASSEVNYAYPQSAFLENVKDSLTEGNFFSNINECFYERDHGDKKYKQMKIWAGYVEPADSSIHLLTIDYSSEAMSTITNDKLNKGYDGLYNFLTNSVNGFFQDANQQSHPIFELVKSIINVLKSNCDNIHLYFLSTNRRSRVIKPVDLPNFSAGGRSIPVHTHLLDIEYLYKNQIVGITGEPIEIDVLQYLPDGLPALETNLIDTHYNAYLSVVPGVFLAEIYKKYGGSLLESNVRSFLSTRGSVNKGIRVTIRENPELFFTYNNGIACTADSIETELKHGALFITKLKNFQIINGGQTTASLRNSQIADKADLRKIFVSMKLTVISNELLDCDKAEMVRNISKYSNTQNKVNASDMTSNHPFYIRFEKFSRSNPAPLIGSNQYQTYWFFERSRGQYDRDQMEFTRSKRKEFQLIHPKKQRIRIVDIAKFYNTADLKPYDVVWGGQINAERFQKRIEEKWNKDEAQFNDLFYKQLIAKGIMFNYVRDMIMGTAWYKEHSGILAELTAYTMSKICYEAAQLDMSIDWMSIWNKQKLPDCFGGLIKDLSLWVYRILSDTNREKDNIGEWCKLPRCWENLSNKPYSLPDEAKNALISKAEIAATELSAKKDQKRTIEVDNGLLIFNQGPDFWRKVIAEGRRDGVLNGFDLKDLESAVNYCMTGSMPPQSIIKRIIAVHKKLEDRGLDVKFSM